jgi:hypothetical protein
MSRKIKAVPKITLVRRSFFISSRTAIDSKPNEAITEKREITVIE